MDKETLESYDKLFRQGTAEHRKNFLYMYLQEQRELTQKIAVLGKAIYELDGAGKES